LIDMPWSGVNYPDGVVRTDLRFEREDIAASEPFDPRTCSRRNAHDMASFLQPLLVGIKVKLAGAVLRVSGAPTVSQNLDMLLDRMGQQCREAFEMRRTSSGCDARTNRQSQEAALGR
jgi:hypothetical protein